MLTSTFLVYTLFGFVSVLLAYFADLCRNSLHKLPFVVLSFIVVVVFWAIRYDIGFDYENYIYIYYELKYGYSSYVEPFFTIISSFFADTKGGEYWVIAAMTFFTYLFLYIILIRKKILWLGLLFSLAFQFQFMAANQIRQAFAISVFLCLLPLIETKQTIKWCIGIILIALICHTSAIFLLFLIPFCRINISGRIWCIIISILFLAYLGGAFHQFGNYLFSILPVPENYQHFLSTERVEAEEVGFSLVMLFNILVALYLAWNYKLKEKRVFTLYMLGICMYIMFIEYHLLLRISFYLFYINIYVASLFCKEQSKKGIWLILASVVFSLFNFAQSSNMHGVIPYKTLFSNL